MTDSKVCSTCGVLQPLENFTRHKMAKGGHLRHCKVCLAAKARAARAEEPEKYREVSRRSKRREVARDKDRKNKKRYYKSDPEKFLERNKKYYKENSKKVVQRVLKVRSLNKEYYSALQAERRAKKRTATPSWVSKKDILSFYKEAQKLTKTAGVKHEVDHLVPLQSPFVCGLHVPWNLRVITKTENIIKSNRSWPDMWHTILEEVD